MPNLQIERSIQKETGIVNIAGLDEAGRGALAGPVVAAAVILPLETPNNPRQFDGVNDSKQLAAKVRERLFMTIISNALALRNWFYRGGSDR